MIIIKKPDYVLSVAIINSCYIIFLLLQNMQRAHLPKEPQIINDFELNGEWSETKGGHQILLIFYLFIILIM